MQGADPSALPLTKRQIDQLIDAAGADWKEVEPAIFGTLLERVKPERDYNRDPMLRERWWLHRRLRTDLRAMRVGLDRFIATIEASRHRFFTLLDAAILPDNKLTQHRLGRPLAARYPDEPRSHHLGHACR